MTFVTPTTSSVDEAESVVAVTDDEVVAPIVVPFIVPPLTVNVPNVPVAPETFVEADKSEVAVNEPECE